MTRLGELEPNGAGRRLGSRLMRYFTRVFFVLGAIADMLGIYAFGALHNWWSGWGLPSVVVAGMSQKLRSELWMVAFAISYPFSMTVAALLTLRILRPLIRDRDNSKQLIHTVVRAGLIYAMYTQSKMVFGGRIKDEYMNISSAVRINVNYLVAGVVMGLALTAIVLIAEHRAPKTTQDLIQD
jgi:hypothetical protein